MPVSSCGERPSDLASFFQALDRDYPLVCVQCGDTYEGNERSYRAYLNLNRVWSCFSCCH
jgi:hypothetical protein